MSRLVLIITMIGVASLIAFGCSSDDEDKSVPAKDATVPVDTGTTPTQDTGVVPQSGSGGSAGTTTAGTGGESAGTGGTTEEEEDDAGTDPTAEDAGEEVAEDSGTSKDSSTEDPLPDPGEPMSVCVRSVECQVNTDDLVCHRDEQGNPGFCTDDCTQDNHCPAVDGLEAVCADEECVIECEGEDDTNCPEGMECRDENDGPGDSRFVCHYPAEILADTRGFLEPCNFSLDDIECEGDMKCYRPMGSGDSGYCTNPCEGPDECEQPDGVEADFTCSSNSDVCRFEDCEEDEDCPTDMICSGQVAMSRCAYP